MILTKIYRACVAVLLLGSLAAAQDWIDDMVKPARNKGKDEEPSPRELVGNAKRCVVKRFNLCRFERDLDGQSQGMLVASDGNVYFAASTRSHRQGAVVFRYLPDVEKLERLCDDLTTVCGLPKRRNTLQTVVSCVPVEVDDHIWWATTSESASEGRFIGSCLVGYSLKTGRWRTLGIVQDGGTIHGALACDKANRRFYAIVSPSAGDRSLPSRLFRVEIDGVVKRDLGVIAYGGSIGYPNLWVDEGGVCWVTSPGGVLIRYDPVSDTMEGWLDALPPVRDRAGITTTESSLQTERRWWWLRQAPDFNRALFTLKDGNALYVFRPKVVNVNPKRACQLVHRAIGPTGLACAVSPDDEFVFVQRERARAGEEGVLTLRSCGTLKFSMDIQLHGVIVDKDMLLPREVEALAVDGKQRVFMVGKWAVAEEEPVSLLYKNNDYEPQDVALCFAVARIKDAD